MSFIARLMPERPLSKTPTAKAASSADTMVTATSVRPASRSTLDSADSDSSRFAATTSTQLVPATSAAFRKKRSSVTLTSTSSLPAARCKAASSRAADSSLIGLSVSSAFGWAMMLPDLSSSIAKPCSVGLIAFIVAITSSSATSAPVTAFNSPPCFTALAKVTTSFLLDEAT